MAGQELGEQTGVQGLDGLGHGALCGKLGPEGGREGEQGQPLRYRAALVGAGDQVAEAVIALTDAHAEFPDPVVPDGLLQSALRHAAGQKGKHVPILIFLPEGGAVPVGGLVGDDLLKADDGEGVQLLQLVIHNRTAPLHII